MVTNFFWIGYHFDEFRNEVAIRKKKLISRPVQLRDTFVTWYGKHWNFQLYTESKSFLECIVFFKPKEDIFKGIQQWLL